MKISCDFRRIGLAPELDSGIVERYGAIAKRIEEIGAEQRIAEGELTRLQATRAEDVHSAVVDEVRAKSGQLLDSLRGELKARTELGAWFVDYRQAHPEVHAKRHAVVTAFVADLNEKLMALGFNVGKLEPRVLCAAHPKWTALAKACDSARSHNMVLANMSNGAPGDDPVGFKANEARIAEIRRILATALANAGREVHGGLSEY